VKSTVVDALSVNKALRAAKPAVISATVAEASDVYV
jgi:hypothetical protein